MEAMTIWKILLALAQTLQTVRTILRAQGISLDDKPVPDQLFHRVKQLLLVQTLRFDPVGSFVVCLSTCFFADVILALIKANRDAAILLYCLQLRQL